MEFAIKKGVSLSTLRRYIKADKIQYRVEAGRYLILDTDFDEAPRSAANAAAARQASTAEANPHFSKEVRKLENKVSVLTAELQRAHKEIAELQTLIAFYEQMPSPSLTPGASNQRIPGLPAKY